MSKKITSLLIILIAVLALVLTANADNAKNSLTWESISGESVTSLDLAVGEETTIRLKVEVPEGKKLKAYSFMIFYDENIAVDSVVASPDAAIAPAAINFDTAGEINVNGFDLKGADGGNCSFVDITLKGNNADQGHISVMTSAFGSSANKQFRPKDSVLSVNVR